MKAWLVALHIALVGANIWVSARFHEDPVEDNEFAEFEDSEEAAAAAAAGDQEPQPPPSTGAGGKQEQDEDQDDGAPTEDGDGEFDHFQDDEEFEGLETNGGGGRNNAAGKQDEPSTLTITKVPLHLRARWDSFYLEILMVAGLVVYFINYIAGRGKNTRIAENWVNDNAEILMENFSLVGDTGKSRDEPNENSGLIKESESQYGLYCTGRVGCDSMLAEIKLIKRHDLIAVIGQLARPQNDQVHFKIQLSKDESENFVLAVATKKTALHFARDIADIAIYCPEKRPAEKFSLPTGFFVMSEIAEAASAIFDSRLIQAFDKYSQDIDYIHMSDQYSGQKQQEDSGALTMPEVKRVLLVGFNISIKGKMTNDSHDRMRPLLQLTFHLLDKLRRFKLSKEGKSKSEKNRSRVEEAFLKTTHAARAEAAAQRREDRRKAEQERILQEEDPDKQRKWEEKEQRRLAKKRAPRMKQLKVKAL